MNRALRRLELALVAPFFWKRPIAARRWWLRVDGIFTHALSLYIVAAFTGLGFVGGTGSLGIITGALTILPPTFALGACILCGFCFPDLFGPRILEPPRQWTLPLVFMALTVGGYLVHEGALPVVAAPGHFARTDQLWRSPMPVLVALVIQIAWFSLQVGAGKRRNQLQSNP